MTLRCWVSGLRSFECVQCLHIQWSWRPTPPRPATLTDEGTTIFRKVRTHARRHRRPVLKDAAVVDCVWNAMAHAQKPHFVFRWNGRVHLNRRGGRGRQFSRLLAAEVCASAVVMLDTPCSEVVWRVLATHYIRRQFPLHFLSRAAPCAITFQLDSTTFIFTNETSSLAKNTAYAKTFFTCVVRKFRDIVILYYLSMAITCNSGSVGGLSVKIIRRKWKLSNFSLEIPVALYMLIIQLCHTYACRIKPMYERMWLRKKALVSAAVNTSGYDRVHPDGWLTTFRLTYFFFFFFLTTNW